MMSAKSIVGTTLPIIVLTVAAAHQTAIADPVAGQVPTQQVPTQQVPTQQVPTQRVQMQAEAPDVYVVQPGDTLWDLSQRFLKSSWYWPKVWSYNPEISNAHYIYPGEKLRFIASNDQQPARVEDVSSRRDIPPGPGPAPSPPPPAAVESGDALPATPVTGQVAVYNPGQRGMMINNVELVTPKELAEAGTLEAGFENKLMLSTYDTGFIKFKSAPPAKGAKVIFYYTVGEVTHPVTKKKYGVLTNITAVGEVIDPGDGKSLATIRIVHTFEPVERGQLVAPMTQPLSFELLEVANQTKLKGVILAGQQHSADLLAQFHYVFIDLGTKDGVKNGNSLVVLHDLDTFDPRGDKTIPSQVVAKLVVVEAKENSSLAMITQSLRELKSGDKVEMR